MNETNDPASPEDEPVHRKDEPPTRTGTELLRGVGHTLVPILLTAGGLIGFVALAGSAIVWTRFSAAEVPPDQVVAIYPRSELVAIASALLLLFGLVGLLAVVLCYLIEPKGRASLGMTRGLLTVIGAEGLAVIVFIIDAESTQQRIIAAESFVLALLGCLWVTFLHERPELPLGRSDSARLRALRRDFRAVGLATLIGVFWPSLLAIAVNGPDARIAIVALALCGLIPTAWLVWRLRDGDGRPARGAIAKFQVPFTRDGMALIILSTIVAVALPALVFQSVWLFVSLSAAAFLAAGLWRAAVMPKRSFLFYGVAVFVSVPLFGTLTWMVQNVFEPQVQPMALIRKNDRAGEYLQGLYVTETDSRIYFASVASEGCSKHLVSGSGRLLSVPKSEVAAIAIGPLQSVISARKAAQEMSYDLAPSPAAPTQAVSLTVGEEQAKATGAEGGGETRRLENVGAAVEPNFGAGLRLVPEVAAPGEIVTLRMSAPQEATRGFGRSRHHRTLRLGGVAVDVAKEQAQTPWEAEYVETSDGKTLKLGKQIAYTRSDGVYTAISRHDDPGERPLFVRVSDRSVAAIDDHDLADRGYLRLKREKDRPIRIESEAGKLPSVTLRDGTEVTLETHLLRQAWHEDHIKFRVPDGASSGPVAIDCNQLSGQPLLRVAHVPESRISIQIQPGSDRVLFDSSRSRDDNGAIVSRHWAIQGIDSGHGTRLAQVMPPRRQGYSVRLTVVDSEGERDSAQMELFRLPARLPRFDAQGELRNPAALSPVKMAMSRAIAAEAPESIELYSRPDGMADDFDPQSALDDADSLRRDLMGAQSNEASRRPLGAPELTIKTLVYGIGCSAGDEGLDGGFDILVLGEGVRVVSSRKCPLAGARTTHQSLPLAQGAF